jgi:hypothetical protein
MRTRFGERIARPTPEDGRRAPALRFGGPSGPGPWPAPCTTLSAVTGIASKSLRALMTGLLGGSGYMTDQTSYLALLRLNGLIARVPGPQPLEAHRRPAAVCDLLHQTP